MTRTSGLKFEVLIIDSPLGFTKFALYAEPGGLHQDKMRAYETSLYPVSNGAVNVSSVLHPRAAFITLWLQ
jgi:hypothetical protein